ncbi:hypothetical protein AMAG_17729 [Allomyces macrogynus ATCC 38327]|uniref:Restriction of telomere capping protein 4 C-terminal domain-containing protein n=1 Tax=Allomyces macrogynus (strain ATCC 38327) TaxID=578462 RepID=A0A0L0RYB5_ALLM3|nr:hypothetical protein AMAG_17729 [Allomyces macrogynus ATCC 38327]|eukprot:KNE55036.1 hypothetical protein AMAG_17729 [Allomyces macrogynus ATCC 38327]
MAPSESATPRPSTNTNMSGRRASPPPPKRAKIQSQLSSFFDVKTRKPALKLQAPIDAFFRPEPAATPSKRKAAKLTPQQDALSSSRTPQPMPRAVVDLLSSDDDDDGVAARRKMSPRPMRPVSSTASSSTSGQEGTARAASQIKSSSSDLWSRLTQTPKRPVIVLDHTPSPAQPIVISDTPSPAPPIVLSDSDTSRIIDVDSSSSPAPSHPVSPALLQSPPASDPIPALPTLVAPSTPRKQPAASVDESSDLAQLLFATPPRKPHVDCVPTPAPTSPVHVNPESRHRDDHEDDAMVVDPPPVLDSPVVSRDSVKHELDDDFPFSSPNVVHMPRARRSTRSTASKRALSLSPCSPSSTTSVTPTAPRSKAVAIIEDESEDEALPSPTMPHFLLPATDSDSDATTDDEAPRSAANDPDLATCPFCEESYPITWGDLTKKAFDHVTSYMAPMARCEARTTHTSPRAMAQFLKTHRFHRSMFQHVEERVDAQFAQCQEHRKRKAVMDAKAQGWPTAAEINHAALPARITALTHILDDVILGTPRPETHFYDALIAEFQAVGSAGLFRSKNRLTARLRRLRPGWYGKQGAATLAARLFELYVHDPENALGPAELGPFQDSEMVLQVLVPTAAALLIQEDWRARRGREVPWDEAVMLMQASADYGDFVFAHHAAGGM